MSQKIALLATGDEIINGDTLNTNCNQIAHTLFSNGLFPGLHISSSDEELEIIDSMNYLLERHDVLITTGGLGPTSDDRTRFALSKVLGKELIVFDQSMHHLEQRFSISKLKLTKSNLQQCYFPKGAKLLPNPHGSAMGCCIEDDNKLIFMLPGPPRECLPMFNNHVLQRLKNKFGIQHQLLKWRIFGLAEGQISEKLDKALAHLSCQTGYRWEYPYIEFKVLSDKALHQTINEIVNPLLTPHIISPPDSSASEFLCQFLLNYSHSLAIKDSATGGLLQAKLAMPALVEKLTFGDSNEAVDMTITIQGLDAFWHQEISKTTTLTLVFSNSETTHRETHQIPYRNQFIQQYAVEFLCYRIHRFLSY